MIVADIRLAIVGNETMPLIDSGVHNRKSPKSIKYELIVQKRTQNGKQMRE
jgi:hypothetical protein